MRRTPVNSTIRAPSRARALLIQSSSQRCKCGLRVSAQLLQRHTHTQTYSAACAFRVPQRCLVWTMQDDKKAAASLLQDAQNSGRFQQRCRGSVGSNAVEGHQPRRSIRDKQTLSSRGLQLSRQAFWNSPKSSADSGCHCSTRWRPARHQNSDWHYNTTVTNASDSDSVPVRVKD